MGMPASNDTQQAIISEIDRSLSALKISPERYAKTKSIRAG
jgi:hypothetical protein